MKSHRSSSTRCSQRVVAVLLAVAAGVSGGCCTLTRLETILAPPKVDPEQERELRNLAAETTAAVPAVAPDRAAVELADADRCDVLDPARCLLPFPNDFFTVDDGGTDTGRRVRFAPESMPVNKKSRAVDPAAWSWSDGFSPGAMVLTHVPGLDLEAAGAPRITDLARSLDPDSPIVWIDADTGRRHPFWAELDAQASDAGGRALILRPAVSLRQGARYVVALRRLRDAAGQPIAASRAFAIYRDRLDHGAPEIERRRPHMEEIFERLAAAGIERDDLFLAWDFTVASARNASERLLHMRDRAFAALGTGAPDFKVLCRKKGCRGGGCGIARRVWGEYRVPGFLLGDGGPGSRLRLGDDGLPVHRGTFTAYFSCIVPERAFEEPARLSLYGHGLLNSLDEVAAEDVEAMAREHNFIFCATNWSGLAVPDTLQAVKFLRDASEFPAIADRLHQGILNTLFLGRLMIHPDGLVSHPAFRGPDGAPLIDTRQLFFDGNSQGTVIGGAAVAVAQDWTRATLGVPGMNYSLFLNRSTLFAESPFSLLGFELPSLQEIFQRSYPNDLDRPLVLALVQMLWDRVELNGHAQHLTRDPYPDTPAHTVLLHEAFGDRSLANVATEILARTIDARLYQPALRPGRDPRPDPFFGIDPIPELPFDGSAYVVWDDGSCPTPLDNTASPRRDDPHGVVRQQVGARLQKAEFLKPDGRVVDVCGGEPCMACGGEPCTEFCQEVP